MAGQWQNFLQNLGEWRGSFATIDPSGQVVGVSPSILTLASEEDHRLVHFALQRWPAGSPVAAGGGPEPGVGIPSREIEQDYRTLGRQVVFFKQGTFCKGSLQVAPQTVFGGEFGFIQQDRRHRLVILYSQAGSLDQLVLIREFRAGSQAQEVPAASADQVLGSWQGEEATLTADWPEPEVSPCQITLEPTDLEGVRLLPDGGFCRLPLQVSHREAFTVEAGWLPAPGRMQRLIRGYDATGAWQWTKWQHMAALAQAPSA